MTDVLIVGAGPTGLTLACDLARRGVDCRVIDKAPRLFIGSRAKGLQPRTLEVFHVLGVLDAILGAGAPFPKFRLYSGTDVVSERSVYELLGIAPLDRGAEIPFPDPWLIPQWRTDEILAERFVELGGRIELATELTEFHQDADGVTAWTNHGQIRARYLVGCDGGHSTVRKSLGVGFAGDTFETERTLIGDVKADGLDGVFCHMFTRAGDVAQRFSLWNLPDTDYYQFVAAVAADDVPALTLDALRQLFVDRSGRTDIQLHDLRWISVYRVNVRMVDRYRVGRTLLAGDAAHVHSSASGQGLNTGVQDAYNLGWKLGTVLAGADDELLDSYETERMPVAAQVLGLSTLLHHRDFQPTTENTPAIHQLDITYRDGPLAVDDRHAPGQLRAGDRAPDGRLATGQRLFDLFQGTGFTLLGFGKAVAHVDLPVHRMNSGAGYDLTGDMFVLVRPDGHIGAISASADTISAFLKQSSGKGE